MHIGGSVIFRDVVFEGTSSQYSGSVADVVSTSLIVQNTTLQSVRATGSGGAVYAVDSVVMVDRTVTYNVTASSDGGIQRQHSGIGGVIAVGATFSCNVDDATATACVSAMSRLLVSGSSFMDRSAVVGRAAPQEWCSVCCCWSVQSFE